jgi:hypothetical protein
MCGPKFCSMHHSRTIEEGIAQLARELEEREESAAGTQDKESNGKQELQLAGVPAT